MSNDTARDILAKRKADDLYLQEKILGEPIPTVQFQVGVIPIEIGVSGFPEVVFTEKEGQIVIEGEKDRDGSVRKVFASGFHQGHKITKIY